MQISQQIGIGLKRLTNQNLITDDSFKQLLHTSSIVLQNRDTRQETDLSHLCGSKGDIVKESFASLLTLLVESARHNLDTYTFSSFLENYSNNSSRILSIVKIYDNYKSFFQLSLKSIGSSYPQIVDVNWRLDYCIKSSSLEHESRPVFFIQIKAEQFKRIGSNQDSVSLKRINFICSLQELQDLVGKLRDATRLVQSIASVKQ